MPRAIPVFTSPEVPPVACPVPLESGTKIPDEQIFTPSKYCPETQPFEPVRYKKARTPIGPGLRALHESLAIHYLTHYRGVPPGRALELLGLVPGTRRYQQIFLRAQKYALFALEWDGGEIPDDFQFIAQPPNPRITPEAIAFLFDLPTKTEREVK